MTNLQIIHLSTTHKGGAGIAARRLSTALNLKGLQSTFISLTDEDLFFEDNELRVRRSTTKKFLSSLTTLLSNRLFNKTYFTLLSVSSINLSLLLKNKDPKKTIIHIHNWFNLISLKDVVHLLRRGFKVVFTLHDQRMFTGGCHYSLDCTNYKSGCTTCPKLPKILSKVPHLILSKNMKLFSDFNHQLFYFAPSRWILEIAQESNFLSQSNVFIAPNPHDVFKHNSSVKLRLKNKITNEVVFGVASYDKNSPLKGNNLVCSLTQFLDSKGLSAKVIYLSDYQSGGFHDKFWSSIDFLLVLSIADNSPNVIHEAKILGIPIIASNVGGISELLSMHYDLLVELNCTMNNEIFNFLRNFKANRLTSQAIAAEYNDYSRNSLDKIISYYHRIHAK